MAYLFDAGLKDTDTVLCKSGSVVSDYVYRRRDDDGKWSESLIDSIADSDDLKDLFEKQRFTDKSRMTVSQQNGDITVTNIVPNYTNLSWTDACWHDLSDASCEDPDSGNKHTDGKMYTGYYYASYSPFNKNGLLLSDSNDLVKAGDFATSVATSCVGNADTILHNGYSPLQMSRGLCGCLEVKSENSCPANEILGHQGRVIPQSRIVNEGGPTLVSCVYPKNAIAWDENEEMSEITANGLLDMMDNGTFKIDVGHQMMKNYCFEEVNSTNCPQYPTSATNSTQIASCPRISMRTGGACKRWEDKYKPMVDRYKEEYCSNHPELAICDCISASYRTRNGTHPDPQNKAARDLYNKLQASGPVGCWFKPCMANSYALTTAEDDVPTGTSCPNVCAAIINANAGGNVEITDNEFNIDCVFPGDNRDPKDRDDKKTDMKPYYIAGGVVGSIVLLLILYLLLRRKSS